MNAPNSGPKPQGLARRHDSQFTDPLPTSSTISPHHADHSSHPRRIPVQPAPYYNNNGPAPQRGGPYPPQQAMRQPTPVIVEMPDEDPTPLPSSTKFNPNAFNGSRNAPGSYASLPTRNGQSQSFKPNRNQSLNQQGPFNQTHQQGQGGHGGLGRSQTQDSRSHEQGLREAYEQRKAVEMARAGGQSAQPTSSRPQAQSSNHQNGNGHNGPSSHNQAGRAPPRPAQSQPSGRPQPPPGLKTNGRPQQQGKRKLDDADSTSAIPLTKAAVDLDVTDFGIDGTTASTQIVEKGAAKTQVVVRAKPLPPAPVYLFNSTPDVATPIRIPGSIDLRTIWKLSESQCLARMKDKEAGTEKELQWVLVSKIFEKQQEGLEDTMSKYNDFIERYNDLADLKNDNLQEKEDLTDRYRRAGATLSTQAGELSRGQQGQNEIEWRCSCKECLYVGMATVEEGEEEEEEEEEEIEERKETNEIKCIPQKDDVEDEGDKIGEGKESAEIDREELEIQIVDLLL